VATRELLKHVKLLDGKYVEDVDVNAKDGHEQTALYLAAMWAQIPIELFTIILNKSIDINAKSKCENTPLSVALWNKSETATRQLLKHVKCVDGKYLEDVDVDIKNTAGDIALHLAAQWTDIPGDLFKWILQKSTNVNAQNQHGATPLHFALWHKSKTATEELFKCDKLDVNAKNLSNATALHMATSWPDIPRHCFRTILEKSADINATNIHGNSPLLLALQCKSVIASEELLGRLLLKGEVSGISAQVNLVDTTRNEDDATALHYATSWPDIPEDIFKKVLHQSIDINAINKHGATPLHIALFNKSKTATEQILEHVKCVDGREMEDVDVNIKWLKGNLALHEAVQWSDIPLDLFKRILDKTTDVKAPNNDGETPLQLANECKLNKEAFELLQHRVDSTV
jgi:ankyrin repeat protein